MLDTWKSSYFTTRAKIEESGRDSRWEFDRKKLFEKTDYMAKICDNLADIAKVDNVTYIHALWFYIVITRYHIIESLSVWIIK